MEDDKPMEVAEEQTPKGREAFLAMLKAENVDMNLVVIIKDVL